MNAEVKSADYWVDWRVPTGFHLKTPPTLRDVISKDAGAMPSLLRNPGDLDPAPRIIPYDRYIDPKFVDLEIEHIWRKPWQIACREEDIPNIGDRLSSDIIDDSYLVVRTGEIYLFDSPHHTSNGRPNESKMQGGTAIIAGPRSHIALVNLLRDEACVKRGKLLFYRTWDFGDNFHINPEYYLKVTDAIEPHTHLIFSIKHQADDFHRLRPFNPTLGIGRHRQIVEVCCQLDSYGKGAHPYYIGDGVINGWEEYATMMKPGEQ